MRKLTSFLYKVFQPHHLLSIIPKSTPFLGNLIVHQVLDNGITCLQKILDRYIYDVHNSIAGLSKPPKFQMNISHRLLIFSY